MVTAKYVAVLLNVVFALPGLTLAPLIASFTAPPEPANSAPTAAFTWSPTTPQEGVQFQFTDLSTDPDGTGDIVLRQWDFGDGTGITFITLTHPSHAYGHAGSYAVTLTVTDAAGVTDSETQTVTVIDVAPTVVITSVQSFTLTQGSTTVPIEISSGTSSAVDFYQYYGASAHMGFETAYQSNIVLYQRTTDGALSMVFVQNIDRDSSGQQTGQGEVSLDLSGIPSGAFAEFSDDPSHCWDFPRCAEFSLAYSLEGQWMYVDNTDGGILSGLPTSSSWCIDAAPAHWLNINSWVYYSNGVDVNLDMTTPATICFTPQTDVTSVTVNEGESLILQGYFDDPSWLDTHTATWDWGDGTTAAATFSPGTGATHHTVDAASHAYGRAGTYAAKLTATDDLGQSGTDSVQVIVKNVDPAVNAITASPAPAHGGETVVFTSSFDDPSWLDVHTATWDFGDGTTASGTFSPGVGFAHHDMDPASHAYAAAGNYTVTLTVCDDFGGCDTSTLVVTVINTPPVANAGGDVSDVEGAVITFSGGFADPDAGDTHTYSWDFGDGGTATGTLSPTHAYSDNGVYAVTLTVCDAAGACDSDSLLATIGNVPPSVEAGPDRVIDEGSTLAITGSFTDPGTSDTHTATWDWGDGSSDAATVIESSGSGTASGSHTYPDDAAVTVSLEVCDDDGGCTIDTFALTVQNVPPTVSLTADMLSVPEGSAVTFAGTFTDPGIADTHTYSWDFGDGQTAGGVLGMAHVYGDDGAYTATLTVCDDDGGCGSAAVTVSVSNVAPTLPGTLPGQTVDEGSLLSLTAVATDPGFDVPPAGTVEDFTATVDWGDGTSSPATVSEAPGSPGVPTVVALQASHVYADNGAYTATLTVCDDDGGCDSVGLSVTVLNVAPNLAALPDVMPNEGDSFALTATATDPGFDFAPAGTVEDFTATVDWGDGTSSVMAVVEVPGSPGVLTQVTAQATHVFADNGLYAVSVTLCDDDGGCATAGFSATVLNVVPTLTAGPDLATDEGSSLTASAAFSDPGFDFPSAGTVEDFTATVNWGDTTSGPMAVSETPGSAGVPTTGTVTASHVYADNGVYTATVTVCDDDGGCASASFLVTVNNVEPTVTADAATYSGSEVYTPTVTFSFSDPGFDFPAAGTAEDFTATVDWGDGSTSTAAVTEVPGSPGVPTRGTATATHAYGDNGDFTVTLTVCDDDAGCGSASSVVSVANMAPDIVDVQAYVRADITLRIAGEKFHDVRMDLVDNGVVTGSVGVVRYPGSPDRQTGTITGGHLNVLAPAAIVLYYTPLDDPVNGQVNGDTPAWVIFTWEDGSETRLKHNFNVRHADTWTWTISDLTPYLVDKPVHFSVTAHDPGSDDLTFALDFGDGGVPFAQTVFNDGVGPDPYPSPGVNPITATVDSTHTYAAAGTYTLTVTVADDDGGSTSTTFTVNI